MDHPSYLACGLANVTYINTEVVNRRGFSFFLSLWRRKKDSRLFQSPQTNVK